MLPEDDISTLPGVGPKKAAAYGRLGIRTVRDLLFFSPREHQDRRSPKKIAGLETGETALVRGTITGMKKGYARSNKKRGLILRLQISDGEDLMDIVFFNAAFIASRLRTGQEVFFYGKVGGSGDRPCLMHPDISTEAQGLVPVYPLTRGITQGDIRRNVRYALPLADELEEVLPEEIVRQNGFCSLGDAVRNIHFPDSPEDLTAARNRLVFEDLFVLQTGLLKIKSVRPAGSRKTADAGPFIRSLPYEMTDAQKRVTARIAEDLGSGEQMNRLLQGDVGSGKTAVAGAAMYKTAASGYQAAFMAPTDILARQHYDNLKKDMEPLGIRVGYLSGGMNAADRRAALEDLREGRTDIAVGTHALIQKDVEFAALGLVVTDEQHRFGVSQRMMFNEKGEAPDILVMTATPIPRTLAVVLYGDMDISVIDELPAGRKNIITKAVTGKNRRKVYDTVAREVRSGGQAYVVCPLIYRSDSIEARSAEEVFGELVSGYPDITTGLLHGEMKQEEKDETMKRFASGEIGILVSTVVIEVGIDVANATVMVIENCERFGLAQMHQLRGRVGRGSRQSYCVLIIEKRSEIALERARVMTESGDGFYIADRDLDLRGPGEIFGTRQHGLPDSHIAGLLSHLDIMDEVREKAAEILRNDPELEDPRNAALKKRVEDLYGADLNISL